MAADPLIEDIAAIVDYAAFYSGANASATAGRRRLARSTAAEILAKIEKKGRLAPPPAEG